MLRIGILGAGHFAKVHIEAITQLAQRARVAYAARENYGQPFPEAEKTGAVLVSPPTLIESTDVDAIAICVPNNLHRHYAEAALLSGKHVFCEKPLAMTVEDADAVIAAAQNAGRVLMVGHVTRHLPVYRRVAEILEEGALGAPRIAYLSRMHCGATTRSWRMDAGIGGGVVFDLLIHDLDLLNWYVGTPSRVTARGRRHAQGGYDYAAALFSYPNDVHAVAEGGFVFHPPAGLRSTLRLVCEHGHIELNTNDPEAPIRLCQKGIEEQRIGAGMSSRLVDGVASEFEEFLDTIEGTSPNRLRPQDARQAVACAAAIIRAANEKIEVAIE